MPYLPFPENNQAVMGTSLFFLNSNREQTSATSLYPEELEDDVVIFF